MNKEKLECWLAARNIYHSGLIAEDTAFSSRSNTFLTFNSILALSFVANLQSSFDKEWRCFFLFIIPSFALVINIVWNWLGCRTMLAYQFYFNLTKEIEHNLQSESPPGNNCLKYFNYAEFRNRYWKDKKRGIISFVSIQGGANKIFCFRIPQIIYLFWLISFSFVFGKYTNYYIFSLMGLIGLVVLSTFVIIEKKINKMGPYYFVNLLQED